MTKDGRLWAHWKGRCSISGPINHPPAPPPPPNSSTHPLTNGLQQGDDPLGPVQQTNWNPTQPNTRSCLLSPAAHIVSYQGTRVLMEAEGREGERVREDHSDKSIPVIVQCRKDGDQSQWMNFLDVKAKIKLWLKMQWGAFILKQK